jgi:cell division protein ZapA
MAELDLNIAGRLYRVACRPGEEDNLRTAAALVDAKSREALAGLGALSEARQLLFAALLLADQMIDPRPGETAEPLIAAPDPEIARRAEALAARLERLADTLESNAQSA